MRKKITVARRVSVFLILCMALAFCKKDFEAEKSMMDTASQEVFAPSMNPTPEEIGVIPAATVELLKFPDRSMTKGDGGGSESSLTPLTFAATLRSGESAGETKTAVIGSAPPKADILFMMDLTGSMGGELSNAKVNSQNIMNSIGGIIDDVDFGLISHMDYPASYNYCSYSAPYGTAYSGDYPYNLDQAITDDITQVSSALNSLTLGNGADGPESYARALYETTADPGIGWRAGARKFVIAWLDDVPHQCAIGTGTDPGRDAVAGTDDDLIMSDILAEMASQNITLIVLTSNYLTLWTGYATATGGAAFYMNPNGTLPSGVDIASYLAAIIEGETSTIDNLTLEVCTPGYESWLSGLTPPSYTGIDLSTPFTGEFEVTYTVPDGTADGVYEFDVCLIGDGAEYGRQHVTITVINTVPVPFDIHPTSCPNPINRGLNGVMPAAILGTAGFDVSMIDPVSVRIEGIPPLRWALEDVATPYLPFKDKILNKMSCNTLGPDGFVDLTLKFDLKAISSLLSSYAKGTVVKLHMTGLLFDGTPIEGEDVVIIVK